MTPHDGPGRSAGDGPNRSIHDRPASDDESTDGDVSCPFCDSTNVEKDNDFGPEISKSQYYCNDCETPFERIKFGESRRPETGR